MSLRLRVFHYNTGKYRGYTAVIKALVLHNHLLCSCKYREGNSHPPTGSHSDSIYSRRQVCQGEPWGVLCPRNTPTLTMYFSLRVPTCWIYEKNRIRAQAWHRMIQWEAKAFPMLPPRQWWGYRRGVSTQSYTLPTYSAGPGAQALSLNCNLNLSSSQASWGTTACCCFGSCLRPGPTLTIALALALGVPRPSSEESMELRPMTSQILTGKKGEDHHDIFMYGMELQKGIPG